jgi:4-amino-4-deoxy-L-arabinose transferase-like glycosyltransferase
MRLFLSDLSAHSKFKLNILMIAAFCLLFGMLGAREIWTQEHRWADIVFGMFYRHDFFHPYLGAMDYYDKPLLSYWLVAGIAWLEEGVTTWALRAPSVLAGLLALGSIYRLGSRLKDERLGLLAGWMLLTTFYFVFWARVSSADMLNMAGSLCAVSWYFDKRDNATFFDFAIFFLILAVTSLCKGLVGAVVALIVIFPDLLMGHRYKQYLRVSVLCSVVPAVIVYLLPFWLSAHFGGDTYGVSGLYLVYRENFLRYFQPFDHKDPIYTYFAYLPIYLLPWAVFFIPALMSLRSRWRKMSATSQWLVWATFLLFAFFTLSGSRRSYYILPVVPFAILLTADWILLNANRIKWAWRVIKVFFILFVLYFLILQPLYYMGGGTQEFSKRLKQEITRVKPWSQWQFVMLDPESKVAFYLQLSPTAKEHGVLGSARVKQTRASLISVWPELKIHDDDSIFLSRQIYEPLLTPYLSDHYQLILARPSFGERLLHITNPNLPIAYVPKYVN